MVHLTSRIRTTASKGRSNAGMQQWQPPWSEARPDKTPHDKTPRPPKTALFLCLTLSCQIPALGGAGSMREVAKILAGSTVDLKYLVHLPSGYGQDPRAAWPLLLFLHGAGECGDDLEAVKTHGPPKVAPGRPDFPFIVVSPQCPAGRVWDEPDLLQALRDLLAAVRREYAVDPRRIYLTGLDMGGYGTWALAASCPEAFAAIAPVCGGGDPAIAPLLKGIPIWVFHGVQDTTIPLSESQQMVDALKACGVDARFTIYFKAGHDSWTQTYDNPQLYDWFLAHVRGEG